MASKLRYWGATISSWAGFAATSRWVGGYAGLAKLCSEARLETAVVRWRHQGRVALNVAAASASILLRPVIVPKGATHVTLNVEVASG